MGRDSGEAGGGHMTATGFNIADPNDGGMLDVACFDAAGPGLIAEFARG